MKQWKAGLAIGIITAFAFSAAPFAAESWPRRTVRIIVPIGAGTGVDLAARLFSARLAERWGHPVIVENRPGADGFIGTAAFAAARDDHVLLYMTVAPIAVYPITHDRLPYDAERDVVPISSTASGFVAVSASAASNIRSLGELVDRARSHAGKLNYFTGVGQLPILFEGFLQAERLDMVAVAYREINVAVQDLAQGRLDATLLTMASTFPAINSGKARFLAIANDSRAPMAPEIETVTEAGYPSLTAAALEGFYGWRDMPDELRDRLSADIQLVASDRAISDRLATIGYVVRGSTPAQFAAALEKLRAKLASIVKLTGAKPIK
jgi:tripartite-type tricarboxylate transporter receptor subunit TctC